MNEINEIGSRLRELREASDYTVERLSAELKVDPEVYRGYEQDGKDIPISLIYEVANKFGVDFAEILTGTPARLDTYHIVRRGHGRVVNRNPEYHFEDLAYRYPSGFPAEQRSGPARLRSRISVALPPAGRCRQSAACPLHRTHRS